MKGITVFVLVLILASCSTGNKTIIVENKLPIDRENETIELTKEQLKVDNLKNIAIKDIANNTLKISQLIDTNNDGINDLIIFQVNIKANAKQKFEILENQGNKNKETIDYCYSRFVPERIDDYAWENNRVAFRVYGPTAQKMVEDNVAGGILSSGVDA